MAHGNVGLAHAAQHPSWPVLDEELMKPMRCRPTTKQNLPHRYRLWTAFPTPATFTLWPPCPKHGAPPTSCFLLPMQWVGAGYL